MIKGTIFDVDGTLIDSMQMWNECGGIYLSALGIKAEEDLPEIMARFPIHESGKYLKEHYNIALTPEEITRGLNRIGYDFYMNEAELKPHIHELLSALSSAGIPMTVATASASEIVDPVLEKLGIRKYFKGIHDCQEIGLDKSNPEFFIRCAELLGTPREDTWMFEDMLHAASSAHTAGLKVGGMFDFSSAETEGKMRSFCDFYLKTEEDFKRFIADMIF